jgi:NitT/TauT family transport system substrate-binding protein
MLNDPEIAFTTTPIRTFPVVSFMHNAGTLSVAPSSWQELFFPEIHGAPGS